MIYGSTRSTQWRRIYIQSRWNTRGSTRVNMGQHRVDDMHKTTLVKNTGHS